MGRGNPDIDEIDLDKDLKRLNYIKNRFGLFFNKDV